MEKIVIFGAGGHSKAVIDAIEKTNKYAIYGLIDDSEDSNKSYYKYPYLGDQTCLKNCINDIFGGVVAIGDNWIRSQVVLQIKKKFPDFKFLSIVHPSAIIGSETKIGDGTVVMPGAIINIHSKIGEHCILNTKCSVDHECLIGDYVSIAPGATLGGNVCIGNYTAISLGSNVLHSKNIGEHSVIGAGATVLNNIDSYVVAYGAPAKVIRHRKKGEKYL